MKRRIKIVNGTNVKYIDDDVIYNAILLNSPRCFDGDIYTWHPQIVNYIRTFVRKYNVYGKDTIVKYYHHEWKHLMIMNLHY